MPTRQGSIKLFRLLGIDVYLHWSWFLALYLLPKLWDRPYSNYGWNALEVLGLFLIVLTHEFGHQLACRQVGGTTHDIVLWPLGGVAYVNPPQRPGAQLWSIAAGPLVNVILTPLLLGIYYFGKHNGWGETFPDAFLLLKNVAIINIVLLVFNLFPVYPLDGGQILRSLLWYLFGRANSLLAASVIGFIGVAVLIGFAVLTLNPILGGICVLILFSCWGGLMQARALAKIAKIPRREGFACPDCKTGPPIGALWRCGQCGTAFDTFVTGGSCPQCGAQFDLTQCLDCGKRFPISQWVVPPGGN